MAFQFRLPDTLVYFGQMYLGDWVSLELSPQGPEFFKRTGLLDHRLCHTSLSIRNLTGVFLRWYRASVTGYVHPAIPPMACCRIVVLQHSDPCWTPCAEMVKRTVNSGRPRGSTVAGCRTCLRAFVRGRDDPCGRDAARVTFTRMQERYDTS